MRKYFKMILGASITAALSGLFFGVGALLGRLNLGGVFLPLSVVCAILLILSAYLAGKSGDKYIFFGLISLPFLILIVLAVILIGIEAFGLHGRAAYYLKLNIVSFILYPFSYYRFRFTIPYTLSLIAYYFGGRLNCAKNGTIGFIRLFAQSKTVLKKWKTILLFCAAAALFNLFYSILLIYLVNHRP